MKKLIIFAALLLLNISFAQTTDQKNQSSNVFSRSDENQDFVEKEASGPGDPVPINDYLPVLMITAVGIIIAAHRKKIVFKK